MEYSQQIVDQVWQKGRVVGNRDADEWRQDACSAWIKRDHYGYEASDFGWKIAHVSAGNSNQLDDLRPYHRENTYNRSTGYSICHVKADREGIQPTAQIDTPRNLNIG
jgi:hypothetical protein